ncbi:MAG: ATP synthase subunit I [Clostridia bacterium]|jgi:ATP synthase I chain.|nr:ATP synthase subunit I [Clostridia bacterium]
MDPAVKKETGYITVWVLLLSLLMEAVFLIIRQWDLSVLFGNLGGAVLAVLNFFLLAFTVSRAVDKGKPEEAAQRVKATATLRLIGVGALSALFIGAFKTNVLATLIPLLFPRVAIAFRPILDRKRGTGNTGTEGSDLID